MSFCPGNPFTSDQLPESNLELERLSIVETR